MKTRSAKGYTQATTPFDYLRQRVIVPADVLQCWEWFGPKDKDGYGQVQSSKSAKELGVSRAHQMSYELYLGSRNGLLVCHSCDNPSCVNPLHLFLGEPKDNSLDMSAKGRSTRGSMRKNEHYEYILDNYKKKSCLTLSLETGLSFSRITQIWRENGMRGKNH